MEFNCSIFADDVVLVLLPLFPFPAAGPLELAAELVLAAVLFPFAALFVP